MYTRFKIWRTILKTNAKYSSIQIRDTVKHQVISYCKDHGYKISGLLEKLILTHISGSIYSK